MATTRGLRSIERPRSAPRPQHVRQDVQHVRQGARRNVVPARRNRERQQLVRRIQKVGGSMEKKKMTGIAFYLVLILALLKDALDPLLEITFILMVLVWPVTFVIGMIIALYYFINHVHPGTKKIILWLLTAGVSAIPVLNILPLFTASFVMTRIIENGEIKARNIAKKKQLKRLQKRLAKIG